MWTMDDFRISELFLPILEPCKRRIYIVSKPINNLSLNITNMMHALRCEVTLNKFNTDIG
jgi:hypothetical protein